ncbi:unnamed protein product [Heligmosomoides polygyrus]|uniref:Elongation of very long chain fatty acids protein n=1 Tax=Heligmosomoides polygyrus TaxID=6339 RepID=A0A183GTT9_HELPZ|nr:unnamed protein product [Heligmosomoides polygyrus]
MKYLFQTIELELLNSIIRLPLNSMGKVFYRTNEGAVVFLNNVHNHFVPGTVSGTVMFLFVFTKVLDLAETVLIVLEGRKPLLIHIFHHVITLLFTWHSYSQQNSLGRWFVFINLFSHVILYSYLSPKKFGIAPCWLFVAFSELPLLSTRRYSSREGARSTLHLFHNCKW